MSLEESHQAHFTVIDYAVKGLRYCHDCKVHYFPTVRLTKSQVNTHHMIVHGVSKKAAVALVLLSCITGVAAAILIDMVLHTKP